MRIDTSSPVAVYMQVEQLIEQLILKQRLAAHEILPGVSVLAKKLNVAPLTVQKAYRRLQERGLIYSISGKGTFVADASDQQFVGILVHHQVMLETAQAPTHAILIQAFCRQLAMLGIQSRILMDSLPRSRTSPSISTDVMINLEHGRPMGLILVGHDGSDALFDLTHSRSLPVVGVGVNAPGATVRVNYDHFAIAKASLRFMVERGITEPAFVWLDIDNSPAERLAYLGRIEQIANECSAKLNSDWTIGVHQASDWAGYHAFNHLCSLSRRPQGLIVLDDVIGQGIHMGVLSQRIQVPDDLSIVVQTNEDSPIVFPQQWQQCGYNLGECGRLVVDVLQKMLGGESEQPDLMFPFKWYDETVRSPWNLPAIRTQVNGNSGPLFRSRRQVLETAR